MCPCSCGQRLGSVLDYPLTGTFVLVDFSCAGPLEYASIIEQYHTVLKEAYEANMKLYTISDISPEVKAVGVRNSVFTLGIFEQE